MTEFKGFLIALGALILTIMFCGSIAYIANIRPIKVKELENNTMFVIIVHTRIYEQGDTVWVNMNTLKIEPNDSTAMRCVIQ